MKLLSIFFSMHHAGHYLVESNCREIVGPSEIYENEYTWFPGNFSEKRLTYFGMKHTAHLLKN